jgi:hypothetical protein
VSYFCSPAHILRRKPAALVHVGLLTLGVPTSWTQNRGGNVDLNKFSAPRTKSATVVDGTICDVSVCRTMFECMHFVCVVELMDYVGACVGLWRGSLIIRFEIYTLLHIFGFLDQEILLIRFHDSHGSDGRPCHACACHLSPWHCKCPSLPS